MFKPKTKLFSQAVRVHYRSEKDTLISVRITKKDYALPFARPNKN